ncbi:MAG TPA: 6-carboxytetrahydropterin synthase [Bacteroidia bacterium]|nr:6-carboxytetrahydropterin synthase [Bacteroidia bacterium]
MKHNAHQYIRVTKVFTFDMAHALFGYDGPCKNIHGHTYELSVTLKGKVLHEANHPKDGMVIDFTDFKRIVKQEIIDVFDHALVLNANSAHANLKGLDEQFEKINYVPYQPSCENLLLDFLLRIEQKMPAHIHINNLKLYETPTSFAEWYIEDNLVSNQ